MPRTRLRETSETSWGHTYRTWCSKVGRTHTSLSVQRPCPPSCNGKGAPEKALPRIERHECLLAGGAGVVMERGALLAEVYQAARPQLISYVTRMVMRPAIAEEIVQQGGLRLTESPRPPTDAEGTRAWLFRAATNLAIDHLRRHSTWREDVLLETQQLARQDEGFIAESRLLQGSPEMRAIAREHLAVCLACTLRAS